MNKRRLLVGIILFISFYYLWLWYSQDNEWIKAVVSVLFCIIGGGISFGFISKSFLKSRNLLFFYLGIGILFYITSNGFWLASLIGNGYVPFSPFANLLWMVGYAFFLFGLVKEMRRLGQQRPINEFLFNIVIFIIVASSISFYYLINPLFHNLFDYSWINGFFSIAYPMLSLSILLVIITNFYLLQNMKGVRVYYWLNAAFLIQVIADSIYIFQSLLDTFQSAGVVDPLWLLSILLIGYSSIFDKKDTFKSTADLSDILKNSENFFPYIAIFILLFLVIQSYEWDFNSLSLGLVLVFVLVLSRQVFMMKKNEKIANEFMRLAYHDPLTGLRNRSRFTQDLARYISIAKQRNETLALILIDLDRFKNVNDNLGHHTGDILLKEATARLRTAAEKSKIYRLGGDEFVIILPQTDQQKCREIAQHILDKFNYSFFISNHEVMVTASIGISLFPYNGRNGVSLLKNADAAMYLAKDKGKNNYQFYTSELNETLTRKMNIETELSKAVSNGQFKVYYQPQYNLSDRKIVGMEALLRWEHPMLGPISPVEFIPIAEETGQIVPIGEWVLREACLQLKKWNKSFTISVNVSARQLQHKDFVNTVKRILRDTGINPKSLELEITESILQNKKESAKVLKELWELGVKTSLDDFGTGYSSLSILKDLPIHSIKIDKSFINDLSDLTNVAMLKTIINIGLNLNLKIIAEGIEHQHQINILQQNLCQIGQGYHLARPAPPEILEKSVLLGPVLTNTLEPGK